jgi:CBS domain containing-hemolysin-like protein
VGEIWDEHDEVVEDIVQLSDGEWRVSGSASLEDLREHLPIRDDFESVTVNGWVMEVLGHLPQPGDAFDYGDLHVTVERVASRRVEQIRIHRKHTEVT